VPVDYGEFTKKEKVNIPATAAGSDYDQSVFEPTSDGKITGVSYTPEANITGDNTESRTLTIVNKGSDGNGTTVMATLAFTTGVNATDFNETAFTLSAVANAINFAASDIIAAVSTHVGSTGLADPGGLIQIEHKRALS
jgi:hypothetical protein